MFQRITHKTHSPLLVEDRPWEPRFDNLYPTVLRDPETGLFRLWYNPFIVDPLSTETSGSERGNAPYEAGDREAGFCYSKSEDGLHWKKPKLGLVEFEGSTGNNILLRRVHGAGVMFDSRDPDPSRRYKALLTNAVAFSPDGLRWTELAPCPAIGADGDTHNFPVWDEKRGSYLGYVRLRKNGVRSIGLTTSRDFENWSGAVEILRGDDDRFQPYSITVSPSDDGFIGMVAVYDTEKDTVDCELALSPDGEVWERVSPGRPFIPRGAPGEFDSHCVFAAAPIPVGDEWWIYYGGSDGPHYGWRKGGLGLARARRI